MHIDCHNATQLFQANQQATLDYSCVDRGADLVEGQCLHVYVICFTLGA